MGVGAAASGRKARRSWHTPGHTAKGVCVLPTGVLVVHQADALDGTVLLKLAAQLALGDVVGQARHKQGLERIALHTGVG